MKKFIPIFSSSSGEQQVLKAYDEIMALWPVPFEDLFIPTRLGSTHVIASGPKDAPPVVLVHAFYASAASWYRNVGSLSRNFRVYAIDMIGDPNKSKPFRPIRKLSCYVDWFNDLMDGLHITQADFIGNSVGAFHIMNYALNEPGKVNRMVLIGPAASLRGIAPFYIHTFPAGMTRWPFLIQHAIRWVESGAPLTPEFRKLFYLMLRNGRSANQVFPVVFSDRELQQIKIPVLLLYGANEVIYDYRKAVQRAEQHLQNLRTEIIPGANHLTAVSEPELTDKVLLDFLNTARKQ
jgi:pimeloyl-ACP methyl ester carboxylesterase